MKQWALNTWLIKLNYNYQSISCLIATLIAFCCTYEIGYCYKWFTDAKLNACSKACKSLRARDTRDNGYVRSISYFRDTMEHYPSTCWEPPPAFSPAALWTHPVSVGKDPHWPLTASSPKGNAPYGTTQQWRCWWEAPMTVPALLLLLHTCFHLQWFCIIHSFFRNS